MWNHEGCFSCRKTYAGHFWKDCPLRTGGSGSNSGRNTRGSNVKKEEVSIVDGYVDSSVQSDVESDSYSSVPIMTVPTRIQRAVVNSGVDPGASINVISPCVVREHKLIEQPTSPVKIHQALDPDGSLHNTKVVSTVTLPMESWTSVHKHEFTVAPLSNHDALLGMPFFTKERILIDPANRSLILPETSIMATASTSVPEGYTRVGNAFMELTPDSDSIAELNELVDKEFGDVLMDEALEREDGVPIGVVSKR